MHGESGRTDQDFVSIVEQNFGSGLDAFAIDERAIRAAKVHQHGAFVADFNTTMLPADFCRDHTNVAVNLTTDHRLLADQQAFHIRAFVFNQQFNMHGGHLKSVNSTVPMQFPVDFADPRP